MKKVIFAMSFAGLVGLFADDGKMNDQSNNGNSGYCSTCCSTNCCCTTCCVPQPKECIDCVCYSPQYYDLQCACGGFVSLDFLYWYGRETGLAFAHQLLTVASETTIVSGGVTTEELGTRITTPNDYKYLNAKWDPGFRVGIGWNSACDGWDLYLNWTYYRNKNKKTASVDPFPTVLNSGGVPQAAVLPNNGQFGLMNPFVNPAFITVDESQLSESISLWDRIKANWKLRLNYIDLELGRKYWLSPCMAMRPYIGVRGGWTRTDFQTKSNRSTISNTETRVYKSRDRFKNDFWGVGLLGGFQPEWHIFNCFSIFGNADFSLIWGCFDIDRKTKNFLNILETNGDTQIDTWKYSSDNDFVAMQAILDLGIGLRWESTYCCDRYRFALDVGWEHHIWFDHNHRPIFSGVSFSDIGPGLALIQNLGYTSFDEVYGNLIMGGLVIQARFDF